MVQEVVPKAVVEAIKPLEDKVGKMYNAFKMLLAQSGLNEDGGIAPLKLVNLEDPESRKKHGLDW